MSFPSLKDQQPQLASIYFSIIVFLKNRFGLLSVATTRWQHHTRKIVEKHERIQEDF